MLLQETSKSKIEYGKKLIQTGMAGARSGREEFLHGNSLGPFFKHTIRQALRSGALGACVGVLASFPGRRRASVGRAFGYGLVGALVGFGAGMIWQGRPLGASMVTGALKNLGQARDQHWLERHPIDYA
jgi:hypothetical protein